MPKIREVTTYSFEELSPKAQQYALEKQAEFQAEIFDAEFDAEDFCSICKILGVKIATRSVPLMGGGTRQKPIIYWSDLGVSWEGQYFYAKSATHKIRKYAPQDSELHAIADKLQALQSKAFYGLFSHFGTRYRHNQLEVRSYHLKRDDCTNAEAEELGCIFHALADWLHSHIQTEYEFATGQDVCKEAILCNEYEFDSNGRIV